MIPGYTQKVADDSVQMALTQIRQLVKGSDLYPELSLNVDFLKEKYRKVDGEKKIHTLLRLFDATIYTSTLTAGQYNAEAMALSRQAGYKRGELAAKYNEAYLSFVSGKFGIAMGLAKDVKMQMDFKTYPAIYSDFATLKSDIYSERGQYDLALETGLRLLDLAEKSGNEYALMKANAALSHYYLRIENFPKARNYCLKGLDYIISLKEMKYVFPKLDEIARMTAKMGNTRKALEIYDLYLQLEKTLPPPGSYIQSVVYMNIAEINLQEGDLQASRKYLSRSLALCYEQHYGFRIPRALSLEGALYLKQKDTVNAILSYEKSLDTAESINAFDVVKSNSAILAKLYDSRRQFSKAYEYRTLHKAIIDSLFTNEKEQKIVILEARRRIKDVTTQNKILALENTAQKGRYHTLVLVLLFAFIITTLAFFSYLKVRSKNKLLVKKTIQLAGLQLHKGNNVVSLTNDLNRGAQTGKNGHLQEQNTLHDELKDIILLRLEKLEKAHFFLDQQCNLHQLADQLKTNHKYLSQVINQEKKSNFNNYINELRINYLVTKLLRDEEFRNSKLSYIAVSVGYNNLNTFNAAFKKRQGILPSYFIDELNSKASV